MTGVELFWTGAGAGLLGALIGPLVAERLQARRRHRDSLRAVLAETKANLTGLRAFAMSTDGEEELHQIPIQISVSLAVMGAMAGEVSGWGGATIRHVLIFYDALRRLDALVYDHRVALQHWASTPSFAANAVALSDDVKRTFVTASVIAAQAIEHGEIATKWIEEELQRLEDWEAPVSDEAAERRIKSNRSVTIR